jgi:capsid protein
MTCSFPFFKTWLEDRFGDLCEQHDFDYVQRIWVRKVASDFEFCAGVAARGHTLLSLGAFVYFTTLGTIYWLWKKYRSNK